MIYRPEGAIHFRKDLGQRAHSDRRILPSPDGVSVKLTDFFAPKGTFFPQVVVSVPETVYVVSGRVVITVEGKGPYVLTTGDVCHIPGNEVHSFHAEADSRLICFYSPNPETGELPDNEWSTGHEAGAGAVMGNLRGEVPEAARFKSSFEKRLFLFLPLI